MASILSPNEMSMELVKEEPMKIHPRQEGLDDHLTPGYFCCCVAIPGITKCCGITCFQISRSLCCRRCVKPVRPTWNRKYEIIASILRNVSGVAYPHKKSIPLMRILADGELPSFLPMFPSGVVVKSGKKIDGFDNSHGHEWAFPKQDGYPNFNMASTKQRKFILYFHGGGFVIGSPGTHRLLTADICKATGATVLSYNYRRAPEFPYPYAEQDSYEAYLYLSSKVDPSRIILGGDSAGAAICVCILTRLRNEKRPQPRGAILLSPYADYYENNTESCRANDNVDWVRPFTLPLTGQLYIDPPDNSHSPGFVDLRGLPPLIVEIGESELLKDVILKFVDRAINAGVQVEHNIYKDMIHVFQLFKFTNQEQVNESFTNITKFVDRVFKDNTFLGDIEIMVENETAPSTLVNHVYLPLESTEFKENQDDGKVSGVVEVPGLHGDDIGHH